MTCSSAFVPVAVGGEMVEPVDQSVAEIVDDTPEVDININNVVCSFSTRCHLNLRQVATQGSNVVYKREQQMIYMKLRRPTATASIWSSGKITITGATSEDASKIASRRVARILQKMGFKVRFTNYRVVNVLGTCILPFGIKISQFTQQYHRVCSYEPELHPGATYRIKEKECKATLKIFQTGAITVTAPNVTGVDLAIQHIYPLVLDFRKEKPPSAKRKPIDTVVNSITTTTKKSKRRRKSIDDDDYEEEEVDVDEPEVDEAEFTDEDLNPDDYSDKSD